MGCLIGCDGSFAIALQPHHVANLQMRIGVPWL
jgi:hypothetical protein